MFRETQEPSSPRVSSLEGGSGPLELEDRISSPSKIDVVTRTPKAAMMRNACMAVFGADALLGGFVGFIHEDLGYEDLVRPGGFGICGCRAMEGFWDL